MTTDTSTRPNSEAESTNLTLSRACICALIHDRLNVWSLYPAYPQSAADNVTTYPVYPLWWRRPCVCVYRVCPVLKRRRRASSDLISFFLAVSPLPVSVTVSVYK